MARYVVGIVRVGTRFATCYSDAGLAEGPERFEGRSRYNTLSPRGRPSGVSVAGEGPAAIILKGPVQLRESLSLRTLLSVSFRSPWRIVTAVL